MAAGDTGRARAMFGTDTGRIEAGDPGKTRK